MEQTSSLGLGSKVGGYRVFVLAERRIPERLRFFLALDLNAYNPAKVPITTSSPAAA